MEKNVGLEPSKPVIFQVQKFKSRKRLAGLIRAFERVISSVRDTPLVFVGDGEKYYNVRSYATRKGLDPRVCFAEFKNQSDLPNQYSIGDISVLPTENEPWALVVNEAMNFGRRIITTSDVGSAYDLVLPGETGYRYPPGDVEALADYLQRLLDKPKHREKMVRKALARIDNWGYR